MGEAEVAVEKRVVCLSGALTLAEAADLEARFAAVDGPVESIDLVHVTRLDTVGAWLVHRFCSEKGARLIGARSEAAALIAQVAAADVPLQLHPDEFPPIERVLGEMGAAVLATGRTLRGLLDFFGATLIALWGLLRAPRRVRVPAVMRQFETVGVAALAIIGLMSFLIGIVIGQQGAVQLRQFGAEVFTINLIGRATLRELGVLMTAIMVAGRSGSAFAAQIGSMKLAEEIDAMRIIGVSPMEALVIPRVLAAVLMMPLLSFYAAMIAILGGGLYCWLGLDIPPATFIARLHEVVPLSDLWVGLIKAPVFGLIIAIAGCFQGMQVAGNAEDVGLRTTAAVVQGIFLVIVLDAAFAVFFTAVGWI